jgi:predicted DNA-binding transcriptional regulator AlpA
MAQFFCQSQGGEDMTKDSIDNIRLLSIVQAAKYLGIGQVTFRKMVERGDAPKPIQITDRRVVWDKKQLDMFIDNLTRF